MSNVLVDTSIWVDHFHRGNSALSELLQQQRVLSHPFVIGEVASGTPPTRARTLKALSKLPQPRHAVMHEALGFIEREQVYGLGCSFIDLVLLASALVTPGVALWTLDKRLAKLTERFNVAYRPLRH